MKATELIKHLQSIVDEHGDLDVRTDLTCGNAVRVSIVSDVGLTEDSVAPNNWTAGAVSIASNFHLT